MKRNGLVAFCYAFVHFSVEVASFYYLFARVGGSPVWWLMALMYDAVAFVPQSIIGVVSDRWPRINFGLVGCLLMAAAFGIKAQAPGLFLIALGNAFVHVDGAQHTLRGTGGRITPNGIFVGAGSFGVITGQLLAKAGGVWMLPAGLMLLSAVAVCAVRKISDPGQLTVKFDVSASMDAALIALLAFVGVTVRGYIAYAIPTEWNKTVPQTVVLFVAMGMGKMLGGILADRIGFRKVTLLSLLGGLPFLLFGNTNMALSLTGVALFSMTMPVTVAVLASAFPKRPGFAFGITTLGLFAGTVPAFFVSPQSLLAHQLTVALLTAAALPSIMLRIKKGR